jgi:hypothetical protein
MTVITAIIITAMQTPTIGGITTTIAIIGD